MRNLILENRIIVSITAGPVIESEPEDTIVNYGSDAMFTCIARGEPAPEIVWLRDSSEIIPLDAHRYEVMNNGTLMVHSADETDSGYFECLAKNPMGFVRSKRAKIILQKPLLGKFVFIFVFHSRKFKP